MRALILDDSMAIRNLLARILVDAGFEVFQASNGHQGLEVLSDAGPMDLALVDWKMPEMGGMEFVRAVRSNSACDRMRVVMVTSEIESTSMMNAMRAGANDYVIKPFTRGAILDKLSSMGVPVSPGV